MMVNTIKVVVFIKLNFHSIDCIFLVSMKKHTHSHSSSVSNDSQVAMAQKQYRLNPLASTQNRLKKVSGEFH